MPDRKIETGSFMNFFGLSKSNKKAGDNFGSFDNYIPIKSNKANDNFESFDPNIPIDISDIKTLAEEDSDFNFRLTNMPNNSVISPRMPTAEYASSKRDIEISRATMKTEQDVRLSDESTLDIKLML
jgi:hypothetical protein